MKYEIEITETLQRIEEVEANSLEEAIDIIFERYRDGEIVLDSSDIDDVEFDEYNPDKWMRETQCEPSL